MNARTATALFALAASAACNSKAPSPPPPPPSAAPIEAPAPEAAGAVAEPTPADAVPAPIPEDEWPAGEPQYRWRGPDGEHVLTVEESGPFVRVVDTVGKERRIPLLIDEPGSRVVTLALRGDKAIVTSEERYSTTTYVLGWDARRGEIGVLSVRSESEDDDDTATDEPAARPPAPAPVEPQAPRLAVDETLFADRPVTMVAPMGRVTLAAVRSGSAGPAVLIAMVRQGRVELLRLPTRAGTRCYLAATESAEEAAFACASPVTTFEGLWDVAARRIREDDGRLRTVALWTGTNNDELPRWLPPALLADAATWEQAGQRGQTAGGANPLVGPGEALYSDESEAQIAIDGQMVPLAMVRPETAEGTPDVVLVAGHPGGRVELARINPNFNEKCYLEVRAKDREVVFGCSMIFMDDDRIRSMDVQRFRVTDGALRSVDTWSGQNDEKMPRWLPAAMLAEVKAALRQPRQ